MKKRLKTKLTFDELLKKAVKRKDQRSKKRETKSSRSP